MRHEQSEGNKDWGNPPAITEPCIEIEDIPKDGNSQASWILTLRDGAGVVVESYPLDQLLKEHRYLMACRKWSSERDRVMADILDQPYYQTQNGSRLIGEAYRNVFKLTMFDEPKPEDFGL